MTGFAFTEAHRALFSSETQARLRGNEMNVRPYPYRAGNSFKDDAHLAAGVSTYCICYTRSTYYTLHNRKPTNTRTKKLTRKGITLSSGKMVDTQDKKKKKMSGEAPPPSRALGCPASTPLHLFPTFRRQRRDSRTKKKQKTPGWQEAPARKQLGPAGMTIFCLEANKQKTRHFEQRGSA